MLIKILLVTVQTLTCYLNNKLIQQTFVGNLYLSSDLIACRYCHISPRKTTFRHEYSLGTCIRYRTVQLKRS